VRLAQRIPVRIAHDGTPDPARLVAGRSATVELMDQKVVPTSSGSAKTREAADG
jgi:multidrug resistance efflux pump